MSTENEDLRAELARMRAEQKKRDEAVLAELRELREAAGQTPTGPSPGHQSINDEIRRVSGRGGAS